jgi:hypothetical protein
LILGGYETWSLILREEYRSSLYGKKVLREIFGTEESKRNFEKIVWYGGL